MKPTLLIGAPGTGKTYQLVEAIREIQPKDFALVSFTRRAANEAKQRLLEFYTEKELEYVRTIHSICFELLGLRTTQVLKHSDLLQFGNQYGYEFTFRSFSQEDGFSYGMTEDDIEYRNLQIIRAKMQEPDLFESGMARSYLGYKLEHQLYDFNDMIYNVIKSNLHIPKFDLVCVDEIQDLTPLQMQFVYMLAHSAKDVIFAGDGNQMIFEWAGVDRQAYLDLAKQCELLELKRNYRLPYGVIQKANQVVFNQDRSPYILSGVEYVSDLPEINPAESYLVLARNGYLLKNLMQEYEGMSILWSWLQQDSKRMSDSLLASTIHGAKGAEADNVILCTDVSEATYEQLDSEAERRVWYVGLTRPRKKLYILEPRTEMFYDLF